MDDLDKLTDQILADPETRKEYERLGPTYQIIGDVYQLLYLRHFDYLELAARMGKTTSVISRFLLGNANPSLAFLQGLAEALDAKLTIRLEPKQQASAADDQKPSAPKRSKKDSRVA
jgi:transcriptional regulator with XRE-family HTH domain